MPSPRSTFRPLLEPVLGLLLFGLWAAAIGSTIVRDVPMRDSTFATNPYAVLIAAGFAVAIAGVRVRPGWSIILTGALLLLQLLYWPARFGQTSWTAYLFIPVVAFGVAVYSPRITKWIAIPVGVLIAAAFSVAISSLLNFPSLSLSGEWGTINGKSSGSNEIAPGFASWAVVGMLLGLAMWRLGTVLRARLNRQAPASPQPTADTAPAMAAPVDDRPAPAVLSAREGEIYGFLLFGMSNREIAAVAHIEESTVKSHVSSVLAKFNVRSRAQLIASTREPTTARGPAEAASH